MFNKKLAQLCLKSCIRILSRKEQLSDYRKEYLEFLDKTGRTRITANEWIGSINITKGLSSSNKITSENHKFPKLLQELSKIDNKSVNKVINKYENIIKNDKIENAIVITTTGEVYQCFGNSTNVWPDIDLGEKLIGAIVTHNHTKEETYHSFSQADIELFEKYKLSKLRRIDNKNIYELNRNEKPIIDMPTNYNDDYGYEHLKAIDYAIKNKIYYNRWDNDE